RRPSEPRTTRSAGGYQGASSSGTRPYGARRDDADRSTPRTRGPRPGGDGPSDRPVRERGDATWRPPRDRAAGPARDGGRDRPSWSSRSREGDRTREGDRAWGGERNRSGERGRPSGGRPSGGRPGSADRERTGGGRA